MALSAVEIHVLSRLLEKAQALSPDQLEGWLAALPDAQQVLVPRLRERLAQIAQPVPQAPDAAADKAPPLSPARAADPRHGERVGPYRLLRALGTQEAGRPDALFQAERADDPARRPLALLLLPAASERQRQLIALPAHPQVVRLRDAGIDAQGRPYRVMPWVDGVTLAVHAQRRRLPLRERLALLLQVCDALAHAHAERVAHGDIKAANVLVGDDGKVSLLDWGKGRLLIPATAATDALALAGVLQALVDGSLQGSEGPDLAAVLRRALHTDPGQRYAAIAELAADLRQVLAHRPVPGAHATALHRARLFARRQRWNLAAGALAVLLLAGAAAWGTRQIERGQAQDQRAEQARAFIDDALPADWRTASPALQAARLQEALEQARAGFAGEPVLRGQVLAEVGARFGRIGQPELSLAVLREALALLQGTAMTGDPALHGAQAMLAWQLVQGAAAGGGSEARDPARELAQSALADCARAGCEPVRVQARDVLKALDGDALR